MPVLFRDDTLKGVNLSDRVKKGLESVNKRPLTDEQKEKRKAKQEAKSERKGERQTARKAKKVAVTRERIVRDMRLDRKRR